MTDRKPQRPRIDAICNSIRKGEYDDKIADIQQAINDRQQERRQQLLTQIQEIYGPNATIQTPRNRGVTMRDDVGPQEDPDGIPPAQESALDVDDDEALLATLPTPIRSGPDPEIIGDSGNAPQFGPAFGPGGSDAAA